MAQRPGGPASYDYDSGALVGESELSLAASSHSNGIVGGSGEVVGVSIEKYDQREVKRIENLDEFFTIKNARDVVTQMVQERNGT